MDVYVTVVRMNQNYMDLKKVPKSSIFFLYIPVELIVFGSVLNSDARTNAAAKYVVQEAHTYDLTCRSREADESGC